MFYRIYFGSKYNFNIIEIYGYTSRYVWLVEFVLYVFIKCIKMLYTKTKM